MRNGDWLVGCIGVLRHFNSKGHIMAVGDAYVFPGFLTPVLTQLFFPKPPTTFLTCFCRGERRKYAGKKSRLNRGSNSQLSGHKSDTLTTEPPGRERNADTNNLIISQLTLSQISLGFYVSAVQVCRKHCGKRRNCS